MKILDFDLEGSHFIIEADISPRQEADDDMECQWLRYDFDNTQVYKETDGAVSPFQITAVAWAGYQLTADHALKDVIGRISRNETGKLTVHYICPELQEFFDELKKYPAITSRDHPAMMYAPDLSQWMFNKMLGLGDMEHNRRLREEREQKRPIITDTKQEIALWNIWIYYQKDIMRRLAQQKGAMGGGLDDD